MATESLLIRMTTNLYLLLAIEALITRLSAPVPVLTAPPERKMITWPGASKSVSPLEARSIFSRAASPLESELGSASAPAKKPFNLGLD